MHVLLELLLPHPSTLMHSYTESALRDENIHIGLRDFCLHDVSILLATIIPCVENLDAVDLDNEHGRSYDMPSHVRRDLDAFFLGLHSELNRVNSL